MNSAVRSLNDDDDRSVDRRRFIAACSCGLMSLAGLGCASVAARPVVARAGIIEIALSQHPDLTRRGGSLTIQPQGFEDPLYVLALENGEFAVLSPICTHKGCTVDVSGALLVCPCHGSTYDRQGNVLEGPAALPLTRYEARLVQGDRLLINIGTR